MQADRIFYMFLDKNSKTEDESKTAPGIER